MLYIFKEIILDGDESKTCIEEEIKNVSNLVISWSLLTIYVHLLVETRCTGVEEVYQDSHQHVPEGTSTKFSGVCTCPTFSS